jgi:competence protein ComFC
MVNILDFIFPKKCLECKKPGRYLCEGCLNKIPPPYCNPHILRNAGIQKLVCLFPYKGVVRKAILALKYKFASDIAQELSLVSLRKIKDMKVKFPKKAVLVPIPLHPKRQNWRGFNQSEVVGKKIAKGMNWYFVPDLLQKTVNTKSQTELKREERIKSPKESFQVNIKYKKALKYPIILFDDVYTTGSTLMEAAKELRKEGVKQVWGLAIAKTS